MMTELRPDFSGALFLCGGFAAAQKKRERKAEIWRQYKRNAELKFRYIFCLYLHT